MDNLDTFYKPHIFYHILIIPTNSSYRKCLSLSHYSQIEHIPIIGFAIDLKLFLNFLPKPPCKECGAVLYNDIAPQQVAAPHDKSRIERFVADCAAC